MIGRLTRLVKELFGNEELTRGTSTGTQVQLMRVHCSAR
jgi:hypothetical protein